MPCLVSLARNSGFPTLVLFAGASAEVSYIGRWFFGEKLPPSVTSGGSFRRPRPRCASPALHTLARWVMRECSAWLSLFVSDQGDSGNQPGSSECPWACVGRSRAPGLVLV
jgi:hypothetical protein